jgi:hypothetical protein
MTQCPRPTDEHRDRRVTTPISSEVVDMTDIGKREPGRFARWRTKRRLMRQQRANRLPPLLDPQERAREDARRHSHGASHDSSAWGAGGFGGGDDGGS